MGEIIHRRYRRKIKSEFQLAKFGILCLALYFEKIIVSISCYGALTIIIG